LAGRKTCTRRDWKRSYFDRWVAAWRRGDITHTAVNKCRRAGGWPIGTITLTCEPYLERLGDMPDADLEAEGGLWDSLDEFIELQGGDPDKELAVIRFTFKRLGVVDGVVIQISSSLLSSGDGPAIDEHVRRSTLKTQRAKARQAKAMAKRAKRAANRRAHRQK